MSVTLHSGQCASVPCSVSRCVSKCKVLGLSPAVRRDAIAKLSSSLRLSYGDGKQVYHASDNVRIILPRFWLSGAAVCIRSWMTTELSPLISASDPFVHPEPLQSTMRLLLGVRLSEHCDGYPLASAGCLSADNCVRWAQLSPLISASGPFVVLEPFQSPTRLLLGFWLLDRCNRYMLVSAGCAGGTKMQLTAQPSPPASAAQPLATLEPFQWLAPLVVWCLLGSLQQLVSVPPP